MLHKIIQTIYRILSSKKFFWIIIGLFVIQALWFALTAVYPMAFDENFHFGIIQIYAHQWSPILTTTPPNSAQYGELLHDPSYLFQYLMSFPYRLVTLFTHDQVIQIIVLRLIDIAFFTAGIGFFYKFFRKIGVSAALINFSILLLVLVPIAPFLAATINYDNLLFLTVPVYLLIVVRLVDGIKNKQLDFKNLMWLIIVGSLGSLVKYAFLPIFAVTIVYLLVLWWRQHSHRQLMHSIGTSFLSAAHYIKIGLLILAIISVGLFMQRYAVNMIEYHSIEPDCSKIESLNECLQYGPWARNYNAEIKAQLGSPHTPSLPLFVPSWFGGMMLRLYFAINYNYANAPPTPLPIVLASAVGVIGIILTIVFWRAIVRSLRYAYLLLVVILAYTVALFYVNFTQYLQLHEMVAINGRYLLPILLPLFVFVGLAFRELARRIVPVRYMLLVMIGTAVIVTLVMLQGGGILTYLVQSNASWYWPHDPLTSMTLTTGNLVRHLIVGAH